MTERRRSPRVDLVGELQGELVSLEMPVRVREISLGGMSVETNKPFDVESRHSFMLTLGDGSGVYVLGRVAYSRRIVGPDTVAFVSGIQFLDDEDGAARLHDLHES